MFRRSYFRVACASLAAAFIVACGGGGTQFVAEGPEIRFVNASPNSAAMTFWMDLVRMGLSIPYLGSTPSFIEVESGDKDIVAAEDSTPESEVRIVQVLADDVDYLVVAYGLVTPPNTELDKRLNLAVLTVDRQAASDSQARVIVFNAYNAALGAGNPSIDFRNPGDTPAVNVPNISYGASQTTIIDAGSQTFQARFASEEGVLAGPETFTIEGGRTYLAVVTGQEGEPASPPTISFVRL